MDHDHEESEEEHEEPLNDSTDSVGIGTEQAAALTGFLFGNIDEEGKLEDDILDEESKRHLNGLNVLGINTILKEITTDNDSDVDLLSPTNINSPPEVEEKSDTAVDYSDINEMAEDDDETAREAFENMRPTAEYGSDYDVKPNGEAKLMPPPSWIPGQPRPQQTAISTQEGGPPAKEGSPDEGKRLNTPLAAMLPPQLADKDVREWFPEFRPGKVLRFSRLFKPTYTPNIWKKKKRKRHEGDSSPDKKKYKDRGDHVKVEAKRNDDHADGAVTIKVEPFDSDEHKPTEHHHIKEEIKQEQVPDY